MDLSELDRLTKQNETADILRRAKALIDAPEKLARGGPYRDGCRLCSLAAVEAVGGVYAGPAWQCLFRSAVTLFQTTPIRVSDNYPFAEVMRMWDRAIALAESL